MLFKSCKFKEKNIVRKKMKNEILAVVKQEVPFDKCNYGRVLEYIDFLIDESEYSIRENHFFYKYKRVKVDLNLDLFCKITVEYIMEHLDDFLLEKHKPN